MNDVTTTAATTTATTANTAANTGTTAAPAWYEGKVEASTLGFWQRKGIDASDPVKVATALTEQYSNAEKLIGVPPDELLRMPKPNAAETDIKAFWNRIGVPGEAKDYDLSAVKRADGKELDAAFLDTIRAALFDGRVPKDRAAGTASLLVKHQESVDVAEAARKTAYVNQQQEQLKQNWGNNYDRNMIVAKDAFARIGKSAGLTEKQAHEGWDALTQVAGVGSAIAIDMMRIIGERGLEAKWVDSAGLSGDPAMLSKEAARQEIQMLLKDKAFGERVRAGDVASIERWKKLHETWIGRAA